MREMVKSLPSVDFELFETEICGTSYCDGGYKMEIKNDTGYRFEYIISGSGTVNANGIKLCAESCDVLFLPKGTKSIYRTDDRETWTRIWVCVKGSLVEKLCELYGLDSPYVFKNCRIFNLFDSITKNVESLDDRTDIEKENAILIHEIIQAAADNVTEQVSTHTDADILREYINSNYTKTIKNDTLADLIDKSESQMIRIFKKAYNTTPYDYALARRIQAAKQMLTNTRMSIRDISMALGFRNEHYFSSCFKERTGTTPLKHRKNEAE